MASNDQVQARIKSCELAFRMQKAMPAVLDLNKETADTKSLYRIDNPATEICGRRNQTWHRPPHHRRTRLPRGRAPTLCD